MKQIAATISPRTLTREIRSLWRRCEKIADMVSGLDKIEKKLPQ